MPAFVFAQTMRLRGTRPSLAAAAWTVGYPRQSMKVANRPPSDDAAKRPSSRPHKARNSGPDISPDPFSCRRRCISRTMPAMCWPSGCAEIFCPPYLCGPGAPDRRGPRRGIPLQGNGSPCCRGARLLSRSARRRKARSMMVRALEVMESKGGGSRRCSIDGMTAWLPWIAIKLRTSVADAGTIASEREHDYGA